MLPVVFCNFYEPSFAAATDCTVHSGMSETKGNRSSANHIEKFERSRFVARSSCKNFYSTLSLRNTIYRRSSDTGIMQPPTFPVDRNNLVSKIGCLRIFKVAKIRWLRSNGASSLSIDSLHIRIECCKGN